MPALSSSNWNFSSSDKILYELPFISPKCEIHIIDRTLIGREFPNGTFTSTLSDRIRKSETISTIIDIQEKIILTQCPSLASMQTYSKEELKETMPTLALSKYTFTFFKSKTELIERVNDMFKATVSTPSEESKTAKPKKKLCQCQIL